MIGRQVLGLQREFFYAIAHVFACRQVWMSGDTLLPGGSSYPLEEIQRGEIEYGVEAQLILDEISSS